MIKMNRRLRLSFASLLILFIYVSHADAQQWAISTNGLYWMTATPNIGVEYSFHQKMSAVVSGAYNPFTFKNNRKMKHWLVQGEYRYWLSESFKGHYWGTHMSGGVFNFGNLPMGALKKYRFEGSAYGAGFTYGYQWLVSNRVNVGVDIGLGYTHFNYTKYYCPTCGERIESYKSDYFGPTKIGVSIIYLLK